MIGSPSSGTVTIASDDVAPDLTETALSVPRASGSGGAFSVTDTAKNQGTGGSAPSTTYFYLSRNFLLDDTDWLIGSRSVPDLTVGATSAGTSTVTLPDGLTAGTYYVLAKADGAGALVETQETNNTRTASIQIGPDLAVTAMSAPASAGAGGTVAVTETTSNQGGGPAAATKTRFYLSSNYMLDATDIPLQERDVLALAAGNSSPATTIVTIPDGTTTGMLVPVHSERTAEPHGLAQACHQSNSAAEVLECESLGVALNHTRHDPFVVIAGSLYLVGEAMELLHLSPSTAQPERTLNEWGPPTQAGSAAAIP